MPIPSPFYPRTSPLCESNEWRDWSGYLAAATYESSHEREYFAIRNAAALIDVSPLYKYHIVGSDAALVVDRIITRDLSRCSIGQVLYTPWCDEAGKVIDDGTVARIDENEFRITSAHPNLLWFSDCAFGMDVTITDVSQDLAALSLQGPNARRILSKSAAGSMVDDLGFFRMGKTRIGGLEVSITRTGYTGDLGYEIWVDAAYATQLWDAIMHAGKNFGIMPAGLVAMDITRIEAGFLLVDIEYKSSRRTLIPSQNASPFELGLGWAVNLKKSAFVGRKALLKEKQIGADWGYVGLELDWVALEKMFDDVGLPPQVVGRASRDALPVYKNGEQVGQATSSTFSPILKKYLALGQLKKKYAHVGTKVDVEVTIEYARKKVSAEVVKMPFFDPPRKKESGNTKRSMQAESAAESS